MESRTLRCFFQRDNFFDDCEADEKVGYGLE